MLRLTHHVAPLKPETTDTRDQREVCACRSLSVGSSVQVADIPRSERDEASSRRAKW